jgi:hypothetical protein
MLKAHHTGPTDAERCRMFRYFTDGDGWTALVTSATCCAILLGLASAILWLE